MNLRGADALGALLLVTAIFSTILALRSEPRAREPLARKDLSFTDDAASCETCHPRQSGEWRRSAMAHAAASPLFLSLEMLIEEQIGRSDECPEGAGVLRASGSEPACRDPESGLALTGAGGEGWCVNCHAPGENLVGGRPIWSRRASENLPLSSMLSRPGRDGVGCTVCHQASHPKRARNAYRGNESWRSTVTGARFPFRVSASEEREQIGNSGYALDRGVLLPSAGDQGPLVAGGAHRALDRADREYLASSEMCGTCHDVRLFGTDVLGKSRGEHFKRLRNGYTEWREFAAGRTARGEPVPTCQSCHLSTFPGVCVAGQAGPDDPPGCPPGTRFEPRDAGELATGFIATGSAEKRPLHPHYFSGVDVPLSAAFDVSLASERSLDAAGIPLGLRARRDLLLARSVSLALGPVERRSVGVVAVPVTVENVGAGHRVPAGFSQERELWVHLTVTDSRGRVLYEVGRVDRPEDDLRDKVFASVTTDDRRRDEKGRPLGLFGADVRDGPDVPSWDPPPDRGGTLFGGRGLVSFQNGFLRCVRCRGVVDANGRCQPLASQSATRAERYEDGDYDPDTGACVSNLSGTDALFETFFPVGALDATRGVVRAPDAIIDTRSLAPDVPVTYVYELGLPPGPLVVEARLLFRAFPPYLLRAFADYEEHQRARGRRPRGPLIDRRALERLDIVEIARSRREVRS